jgi:hypothetical protein
VSGTALYRWHESGLGGGYLRSLPYEGLLLSDAGKNTNICEMGYMYRGWQHGRVQV